jgi:Flp pilus assembly protein TadD
LAAAYAQMGHLAEARAEVATILELDPSVCLSIPKALVRKG